MPSCAETCVPANTINILIYSSIMFLVSRWLIIEYKGEQEKGGMSSLVARFLWHVPLWFWSQVYTSSLNSSATYFLAMIFCLLADLAYLIARKAATTPMITTNCRKDMNNSRSSIYTAWVSLIISHAWHDGCLVYIFNRYLSHEKFQD